MSIELQEARKKLDTIEALAENPELCLTELFSEGVSGTNFLRQIRVRGKSLSAYLKEYLLQIDVFSGCLIEHNVFDFYVLIPGLKAGIYTEFQRDDRILKVDADRRTFSIINENIEIYEKLMSEKISIKQDELSTYFKYFENLTIKKRLKNMQAAFKSQKKPFIRIQDFFFWVYVPSSKVTLFLERERKRIEKQNKEWEEEYDRRLRLKAYYAEYAPKQIDFIKNKQKEISYYLLSIGYTEDKDMPIY